MCDLSIVSVTGPVTLAVEKSHHDHHDKKGDVRRHRSFCRYLPVNIAVSSVASGTPFLAMFDRQKTQTPHFCGVAPGSRPTTGGLKILYQLASPFLSVLEERHFWRCTIVQLASLILA
jgi:hypothetical protein